MTTPLPSPQKEAPLLKKLNWKEELHAGKELLVWQAPEDVLAVLQAEAAAIGVVLRTAVEELEATDTNSSESAGEQGLRFAIAFATKQVEVDAIAQAVCPLLVGDALLWICYPKGSSKRYKCDFNRDTGWAELGRHKLEPVRQVALDADWSALRFRNIAYIKNWTRRESMALSEEGKSRSAGKG